MTQRLETARELALQMPERWGVAPGPRLLGPPDGVSALQLISGPAEAAAPASDAHILSYIARGEPRHRLWYDGREIADGFMPDRSLALVPAGVSPRAVVSDPIKLTHIYLPHAFVGRKAMECGWRKGVGALEIIDPAFRPDEDLLRLCECVNAALADGGLQGRLYFDALVLALVSRLLQKWSNMPPGELRPVRGGLSGWQLRRVTEFIDAHLDQDLMLDDLAELANLSAKHFARAFRQSTGVPPHRWLIERRIARAKALLVAGDLNLAEIAVACGFADQSHFTAAFRRGAGLTPGAYRRETRL